MIIEYGHQGGIYIEPFAGGAAVAMELLETGVVSEVVINDLDKGIYSFWRAILTETERFIKTIEQTPITIDEWIRQHDIYMNDSHKYSFELGFATFFLNRTNRSGIIKGGVIGGKKQTGDWTLDARFNKQTLIDRIRKIASMKANIHLYNKDIKSFLLHYVPKYEENAFIYFDPPYFEKGKQLYLNFFDYNDHVIIEKYISKIVNCDWIITYDDTPQINQIYKQYETKKYDIQYSVAKKRKASELMIFKRPLPDCFLVDQDLCKNGVILY